MKVGDWVNRKGYPKELGVITSIDTNLYFVQWLAEDRKTIDGYGWFGNAIIFPAPIDFDEYERDALFFDLALLGNNISWAKELYTKLNNCG